MKLLNLYVNKSNNNENNNESNNSNLIKIKYKNNIYDIYNRKNYNNVQTISSEYSSNFEIIIITDYNKNKEKIAILNSYSHFKKKKKYSINNSNISTKNITDYLIAIIIYINLKYNIQKLILSDNAMISCLGGKKMILSDLYYIKYNKTYYEKKFNGVPYTKDDKLEYELNKKKIDTLLEQKINIDYNEFIQRYYYDDILTNNIDFNNMIRDKILKVYDKKLSYFELLKLLKNEDCIYYNSLIKRIFDNKLLNIKWIINTQQFIDINHYEYFDVNHNNF